VALTALSLHYARLIELFTLLASHVQSSTL